MADLSPNISIITLNDRNTSTKRQNWHSRFLKNHPTICYLQETHYKYNNTG